MNLPEQKNLSRIKQIAVIYNQAINVFWSVLCFAPIGYFCYVHMAHRWFYILLGISLATGFLPNSFYHAIQFSQNTLSYKKLGIRTIKKYTQDGDLVNRIIKKRYPEYKYVEDSQSLKKYIAKGYVNEKFHFSMFVFFLFTTIYALIFGWFRWAAIITLTNIIFNVLPVLLQQYNRIRINYLIQKQSASKI